MKTNEWNLLKDHFDALVHSERVREESIEILFDGDVHRHFGALIARAGLTKLNRRWCRHATDTYERLRHSKRVALLVLGQVRQPDEIEVMKSAYEKSAYEAP